MFGCTYLILSCVCSHQVATHVHIVHHDVEWQEEVTLEESMIMPQTLVTAIEYPPELEYEDMEAKEANKDEIVCWLQHLSLGQYNYLFKHEEIDFDILLEVSWISTFVLGLCASM